MPPYWIFQIKATHLDLLSNLGIIHDHPRITPQKKRHVPSKFPIFSTWKNMVVFSTPWNLPNPPQKKTQISGLLAMVVWTKITETVQIPWSHLKPREGLEDPKMATGVLYSLKSIGGLKASPKMNNKQSSPPENRVDSQKERILYSSRIHLEKVRTCAFQGGYSKKLPMKTSLSLRFPKTYIQIIQHKSLSCLFSYQQERSTFQFGDCTLESLFRWRPVKLHNWQILSTNC